MNELELYYDTVFSYCEGFIAVRGFDESGEDTPFTNWVENKFDTVQENINSINSSITYTHKSQYSCLCIPCTVHERGEGSAVNIYQTQVIVADIDSGDINSKLEHAKNYIGLPSLVIASGGITPEGQNKIHVYWKLDEAIEKEDLEVVKKHRLMLAKKIGADEHFGSMHQPIRIAGSFYHKNNNSKKVKIIEHNDIEYSLCDITEHIEDMPALEGIEYNSSKIIDNALDFNSDKLPMAELLLKQVRAEGADGVSRFEALSRVIGYWLHRHHEGIITMERAVEEIYGYNEARVNPSWDKKKLNTEINSLWNKKTAKKGLPKNIITDVPAYPVSHFLNDDTPMPEDLIAPRLLTPGGLLVLGGAPKVGKSDLLLSLLVHMSSGLPFLGLTPPRPLRIFYLQAEIGYYYLRERLRNMVLSEEILDLVGKNLVITSQCKMLLNEGGVEKVVKSINKSFTDKVDIIVIDPLRNVFDGGDNNSNENDNSAMMQFLQSRIDSLREAINPEAGIIIAHHISKVAKNTFKDDPFQFLSGASSLRGYYTAGLIMFQPDEKLPHKELYFELRNGERIDKKTIAKKSGSWEEIYLASGRMTNENYGQKQDSERRRKYDVILQIIYDEARLGNIYIPAQFAKKFENTSGLGGSSSIERTINTLATKGYIKYFRTLPTDCPIKKSASRSKYGFLCVEDMSYGVPPNSKNANNEEVEIEYYPILPSYYKNFETGGMLEMENPKIWIYHDHKNADLQIPGADLQNIRSGTGLL